MANKARARENPTEPDDYVGQQRAVDTRLSILKHASKIFASKGFDGCSTRDIATAAGVSHANIRYHFGDKEALWFKVINYLIAEEYKGRKLMAEIQSGTSLTENFRQHTRNAISHYAYNPELPRIILYETLIDSDRLKKIRSAISDNQKRRSESVKIMQDAGLVKNINPQLLDRFLDGGLTFKFVISNDIDRNDIESLEQLIDDYTEMVVQLVQK